MRPDEPTTRRAASVASVAIGARAAELLADSALAGRSFCVAYSALVDGWLGELLGDARRVALVAVGSYGRAELCPKSDLDLVLVHARSGDVETIARRLWYPIWDAHFQLDHSVRTVGEALAVARSDLKAELGLLDARHVAGDRALAAELIERSREQWREHAPESLAALGEQVRERHRTAGELGFLLEPELKDGRGGLRDAALLGALRSGFERVETSDAVREATDTILAARVALHRRIGRTDDRLLLEYQDEVAADLGLTDADALMAGLAAAARTISWHLGRAWRVVAPPTQRRHEDAALGHGIVVRDAELELGNPLRAAEPATLLQVATIAAHHGVPIGLATLQALDEHSPILAGRWPDPARDALVSLLGAGVEMVTVFETLDQYDLVSRVLPEWAAVRNKPQRNAFHRFTVDRHLIEAAARATAFTRTVARPDLLLVGAWLHDIGKGFAGDHTDVGVELVGVLATRMGFVEADRAVLVDLVRHHLLLPSVATSRDLNDPETIAKVAAEVGDTGTLELLAALTEADSLATGPAAWSSWKADLIKLLVSRVGELLRTGRRPSLDAGPSEEVAELVGRSGGQLLVDGHADRLDLVSPDRPGLFAATVGLLGLHGQDVRSAEVLSTEDGLAVDRFIIEPTVRPPDWPQFAIDLDRVLSGRMALEPRLAARAGSYATRRRRAAAHIAEPVVLVHDDESSRATIVEVRAPDGIGVLYRISRALADLHLDIRHAKVATIGHEAIDTFYVLDVDGKKIDDGEVLGEIRLAVLFALRQRWVSAPGDP